MSFVVEIPSDLLVIDGPSTYHPKQTLENTERAFERIQSIDNISSVIIDHHLLRDLEWETILKDHGIY